MNGMNKSLRRHHQAARLRAEAQRVQEQKAVTKYEYTQREVQRLRAAALRPSMTIPPNFLQFLLHNASMEIGRKIADAAYENISTEPYARLAAKIARDIWEGHLPHSILHTSREGGIMEIAENYHSPGAAFDFTLYVDALHWRHTVDRDELQMAQYGPENFPSVSFDTSSQGPKVHTNNGGVKR